LVPAAVTNAAEQRISEQESVQNIQKKLAEAKAKLAAEAVSDSALTNIPAGVSPKDLAAKRAMRSRLVRLLEQQLSNISELTAMKSRQAEVARQATSWTRFTDPPPYSILLTDRIREESQVERLKLGNSLAAVSTLDQLIVDTHGALAQAEEKIRQLDEQLEATKDPSTAARLSWQRGVERLRSQLSAASLGTLESERQLRQQAAAESQIRLDWRLRQLVIAEADTTFTPDDLEKVTAQLDNESRQFEAELTDMQLRSTNALTALESVRAESRSAEPGPGGSLSVVARLTELLSAREAQAETAQAGVRILRLMLETENVERAIWELRFAAHDSRSVARLSDSERRLKDFDRRAVLWKDFQRQQLELSSSQIELQEARALNLATNSELHPLALERLAALRERDQLLLRLLRRIELVQRASQRWAEELHATEQRLPVLGRMQNVVSGTGSFLQKLWTFELFTAEDTIVVEGQKITGRRSVTLGKVCLAALILGVGIWITGLISRIAEPIIVRRLNIETNQARLIRRWLRALMVLCLVMFSLVSVKIPLTVFAFAGGALAIGLGFGMQTLLKNFVSGLILLFERPFRIGDILEVSGQRGMVTEIGLRSSVLQLWDGTETLIPNSSLLESNVSNWTYSNRKVRFTINVGVAYGSDTRRVIQLLSEAADRHGVVEKEPKPQVFFTDFAPSALTFELRYWVDVIKVNAAQVGSDLRQMIVGAFAENGIVIAFPQSDVHLDAGRPLAVQIVSATQSHPLGPEERIPDGHDANTPLPSSPN
jgi:small-conductance mechanosensitive channel